METKKINEIEEGEMVVLQNKDDGSECIAELMSGGLSGGCEYDMYMAYIAETDDSEYDTDDMPYVCTDSAECAAHGISL